MSNETHQTISESTVDANGDRSISIHESAASNTNGDTGGVPVHSDGETSGSERMSREDVPDHLRQTVQTEAFDRTGTDDTSHRAPTIPNISEDEEGAGIRDGAASDAGPSSPDRPAEVDESEESDAADDADNVVSLSAAAEDLEACEPDETVVEDVLQASGADTHFDPDAGPPEVAEPELPTESAEPEEESEPDYERRELVAPTLLDRVLTHPKLMPYNRLAVGIIGLNVALFYWMAESVSLFHHGLSVGTVANAVLANFTVAIVIRLREVINGMFHLATNAPKSWPLSVRWMLGKVYHFGGIHIGCFVGGTLWLGLLLTTSMEAGMGAAFTGMLGVHVAILTAIMITALPQLRHDYHDLFEVTARFGTWTSVGLFWAQTLYMVSLESCTAGLFSAALATPQVWILAGLTFIVALPWLRMRKVDIDVETPSSHAALADFDFGVTPFAGSSTELSRDPLFEWHTFANVMKPDESGFRLTISRAGDWTGEFIDDPPDEIWVKGLSTAGVGNIETLFNKVLWVSTGSGIGPCLPHLLRSKVPSDLVWCTKSPRDTYGDELVDELREAVPDATIWDTDEHGRPDLTEEAFKAYEESDADAVICISNKPTTFEICHEFESHGVPAFGAIWDS